jgi:hypothetical protein
VLDEQRRRTRSDEVRDPFRDLDGPGVVLPADRVSVFIRADHDHLPK